MAPLHQSINTVAPTHASTETAGAQQLLCKGYTFGARTMQVDTNADDKAVARNAPRASVTVLYSASNDPVLNRQHRMAADALATAYLTDTAKGSDGVAEKELRVAVAHVNAKGAAMKKVCGGV
ncbi:hypothetical protein [Mycobacterium intracellulare]|nr:hypothetical protein [Mycobacterium intracellulare]